MSHWCRQRAFDGPTATQTFENYVILNSCGARGFRKRYMVPFDQYHAVVAFVVGLGKTVSPTAVPGRVRTLVFYAVDTMFRAWSRPHITDEVLEAVKPAWTDCYSASAVTGKFANSRVVTTTQHGAPDPIFLGVTATVRDTVGPNLLQIKAAARFRISTKKTTGLYVLLCSAFAMAEPTRSTCSAIVSAINHRPSTETLSGKVLEIVDWFRIGVGHLGTVTSWVSRVGAAFAASRLLAQV